MVAFFILPIYKKILGFVGLSVVTELAGSAPLPWTFGTATAPLEKLFIFFL